MPAGDPNFGKRGFGSRPREVDDEYRSRIKGVPRKRVWTKEKIHDMLDELLTAFKKILLDDAKINANSPAKLKAESVRDLNNMMNRLIQVMDRLYPNVNKNVNLNIDVTTDAVMERLKEWKKEQVVVIGEVETDENGVVSGAPIQIEGGGGDGKPNKK